MQVDGYGIGTLSKLTGLSIHTLRVWERRYQALTPSRTPGGTRRYPTEEVARARTLAALVSQGFRIGEVAGLSTDELQSRLAPAPSLSPVSIAQRFIRSVRRFSVVEAEELLFASATVLPTMNFLTEVASPILQEVGRLWEAGEFRIAHEHAAVGVVQSVLARIRSSQAKDGAPVCVSTTLAGERHELGALAVSLVATLAGYRSVYLGADLPAEETGFAVRELKASYLMLSVVHGDMASLRRELAAIEAAVPSEVRIIVGGAASFELASHGEGRTRRLPSLTDAYAELSAALPAGNGKSA
ncbi:MAG: MerR family transcriptional regulator [Myxococcota bacterium]